MSGVRNLRAMFEQKGETSPPERGRSPGIPPSIASESPRPLSKVRTNFIAIEKDGRIGLQRENSQDSSISATRKFSGDSDISTPPARKEDTNIFADNMAGATPKTSLLGQPIPESPRTESGEQSAPPAVKKPEEPKSEATTAFVRKLKKVAADESREKTTASSSGSTPALKVESAQAEPVNGTSSQKGKGKAIVEQSAPPANKTTARLAPKPLTVPSASKTTGKASKSPVGRAPRSPATTAGPSLPAKTPDRTARQPEKERTETTRATASSSNPPRSSSIKRPPPLQPSPASTGFVKPKVKSPTRPVRLPAGLLTHTASSGSKVNAARLAQASGPLAAANTSVRSPSRVSVSTVATTSTKTAGTQSLKRQSSTINRPRPSLGPPPKQAAKEYPPTKKEKDVDESFLARMMRPTQASSSKTTDKAPTTPPRKPSSTPAVKHSAGKAESRAIRRTTPRALGVAGPSETPQASSADDSLIGDEIAGVSDLPAAQGAAPIVEQPAVVEEAGTAVEHVEDDVEPTVEVSQLTLEDGAAAEVPLVNGDQKGEESVEETVEEPTEKATEEATEKAEDTTVPDVVVEDNDAEDAKAKAVEASAEA